MLWTYGKDAIHFKDGHGLTKIWERLGEKHKQGGEKDINLPEMLQTMEKGLISVVFISRWFIIKF